MKFLSQLVLGFTLTTTLAHNARAVEIKCSKLFPPAKTATRATTEASTTKKKMQTKKIKITPNDGIAIAGTPETWQAAYEKMIKILLDIKPDKIDKTTSVYISGNPMPLDPDAFQFNVWGDSPQPDVLDLLSPKVQESRAVVDISSHRIHYQNSDMAGWVNLFIQLDKTNKIVTGVKIYKSLPNGEIYQIGLSIGEVEP